MKALDENFLMVVFTLLLNRVPVFLQFVFIWTEKGLIKLYEKRRGTDGKSQSGIIDVYNLALGISTSSSRLTKLNLTKLQVFCLKKT